MSTPLALYCCVTPHRELLPGVSPEVPPPVVVFASGRVIRRARRRALWRDAFDLLLLVAVDVFFVRWPFARLPLLGRHGSLELLVAVNVLLIAYLWATRSLPGWRARRVSGTWSEDERSRLTDSLRSRATR